MLNYLALPSERTKPPFARSCLFSLVTTQNDPRFRFRFSDAVPHGRDGDEPKTVADAMKRFEEGWEDDYKVGRRGEGLQEWRRNLLCLLFVFCLPPPPPFYSPHLERRAW